MEDEHVLLVPMSHHSKQNTLATESSAFLTPPQPMKHDSVPSAKKIRKPIVNRNDVYSLLAVLACFAFAVTAVTNNMLAFRLGQTNQLILLGLMLSVMSSITLRRAHVLLLLLEARFGSSTLQNYDAILRDDKFSSQSSIAIRSVLLTLFVLPLGLSASYKRYVNGHITIPVSNHETIVFAPSGPGGLFAANGRSLFVNATSVLYDKGQAIRQTDLPDSTTFGYNMCVINGTVTAMLDTPVVDDESILTSQLQHGTFLTITARVGATFARLNSTPDSLERRDPQYWARMAKRFFPFSPDDNTRQMGSKFFGMWSMWVDSSLIFLSISDQGTNESFYENAVGFNLYRGTACGTWRISLNGITLQEASDFETDFSPDTIHPEVISADVCNRTTTSNTMQKIIFCGWSLLAVDYEYLLPDFILDGADSTLVASMSVWVAAVAAMGWSSRVAYIGNLGRVAPEFQYILQTPTYRLWASHVTLHRHLGLYATLAALPLLLLLVMLIRISFRSTPVSDDFGLVTLLAGVRRSTLDVLKGASYTGKLKEDIVVQIVVRDDGKSRDGQSHDIWPQQNEQRHIPVIEYDLSRVDGQHKR